MCLLQAPGVVTSLTSTPQVFNYKGTSYVTNVATKLRSEADLTEPGLLSGGKKHQVTLYLYISSVCLLVCLNQALVS